MIDKQSSLLGYSPTNETEKASFESKHDVPFFNNEQSSGFDRPHGPLIIGVAGGTASGKTTVCLKICEQLHCERVNIISMDSFYKPLTPEQRAKVADYNFDHPNAFDWDLLLKIMRDIAQGFVVEIPQYDFVTHSRTDELVVFYPGDIVMFEGILALHNPPLKNIFKMKLFVDADADTRLCRRLKRDIVERGRTAESVIDQYQKTVKLSYEMFAAPTKVDADIIIPHGGENKVAIDLLATHIRSQLHFRGRINISADNCNVPKPLNLEEKTEKDHISLSLLERLRSEQDMEGVQSIFIDPYHQMIFKHIQEALDSNLEVSIITLVQNSYLQRLTDELGITKVFYVPDSKELMESSSSYFESIVIPQLEGTHVFVIDAFTFSGNRVRAILIWIKEHITFVPKVSCISMICSQFGLTLLGHSFSFCQFYTLSQLEELNNTLELQDEATWIHSLLLKEKGRKLPFASN